MDRTALLEASAQPGGRAPAPGELALVQAFVNTVDREHGPDLLDDAAGWLAWAEHRSLRARTDPASLDLARDVREALRVLLWRDGGEAEAVAVLDRAGDACGLRPRFGPARVEAAAGDALGAVLAAAFGAMADGSWERLKACPGDRCGWAFYDRSVNGASTWCSMRVCGNRTKARAYYRRRSSEP